MPPLGYTEPYLREALGQAIAYLRLVDQGLTVQEMAWFSGVSWICIASIIISFLKDFFRCVQQFAYSLL